MKGYNIAFNFEFDGEPEEEEDRKIVNLIHDVFISSALTTLEKELSIRGLPPLLKAYKTA